MDAPLKITWINPVRIEDRQGVLTSDRVCVRLRSIVPAIALAKRGHSVNSVSAFDVEIWGNDPAFYDRDAFIIGKAFIDVSPALTRIRESGRKIIVDLCDNIFEPPEDGFKENYLAMLPLADAVVTSSEHLRAAIMPRLPKGIVVETIPDCVEGRRLPPTFAPSAESLKLLWFGYPNNLPLLHEVLPGLEDLARQRVVELAIVTTWNPERRAGLEGQPFGLRTRLLEWSVETTSRELARCDMVLIPSDESPARLTKSANRAIASLWAGKYPVAYPLPSYAEFAPFAGIGKDLPANVLKAIENPAEVLKRISAGQDYIANQYSNAKIAEMWETLVARVLNRQR